MSNRMSAIAVAIAITVTLAGPAAAAGTAGTCKDYFDCGYTMPEHLIIRTGQLATPTVDKSNINSAPVDQGPPNYNDWQANREAESNQDSAPVNQGPPNYNDWQASQEAK